MSRHNHMLPEEDEEEVGCPGAAGQASWYFAPDDGFGDVSDEQLIEIARQAEERGAEATREVRVLLDTPAAGQRLVTVEMPESMPVIECVEQVPIPMDR